MSSDLNQDPGIDFDIPECAEPIWIDPRRWNIMYGGRGSTKSWTTARILGMNGFLGQRRILCAREIQRTLKESVYQLILDQLDAIDLIGHPGRKDFYKATKDSIIGLNGTQFMFHGIRTEDIAKIKSLEGVDDCWVEEAHTISAKSWRILVPTIRKDKSRFYVTFNPELVDDPTYERLITNPPKDSHVIKMNWTDNPWWNDILEQERLADYERDDTPDKHVYKHTWEGYTLPAVEGAIFANEVAKLFEENRVRPLDYDPMGLVYGIMDLGWGVQAMTLAQRFGNTINIVGYHEWENKTYAQVTLDLHKEHPDYRWGKIFMPHDASHKDPKTGHSHFRVMEDLGWDTEPVEQIGIENYIEKGRKMFSNVYISDAHGCDRLIHCLRRFKYKVAATNEDKKTGVEKDDYSHGAESYCYTAVVANKMVNESHRIENPYAAFKGVYAG